MDALKWAHGNNIPTWELPEWLCNHNIIECCLLNNTNIAGCKRLEDNTSSYWQRICALTGESVNQWDVVYRRKAYKW